MSEKDPLALVIDFGSQSVRLGATNLKGEIIALVKKPYDPVYVSSGPGLAEQDADFYWNRFIECAQEFRSKYSNLFERAIGITLTSFRDTAVLLDKNMKPIRPCIHWLDQRLAKPAKELLPFWKKFLFKLVRMEETLILNRRKTMAIWYQQNEPDNWKNTVKYASFPSYMHYKLCGRLADSPSNFTGHFPIDYKTGKWYKNEKPLKNIFNIPIHLMPEIVRQGEIIGSITKEASFITGLPAGIPIYSGGSDKSCETLGVGALDSNIGSLSYGTSCTIEVSNKKYHEPEPFLPAYQSCLPDIYNMEVQIYRGYWMLTWFTKEFAQHESTEAAIGNMMAEEVLNAKMMQIAPGCNGLVLQPYWGAGLRRPVARGGIIGFNDGHTKIHLYRAILEGIAYALREGLEGIEKSQKQKITELRVSGGGSQSDAICQITADIFGRPVSRVQTYETSTLGGAIALFIASGYFKTPSEAVASMVHPSRTFLPNPDAQQKYEYLYTHVYTKMYGKLKNIYADLKDF